MTTAHKECLSNNKERLEIFMDTDAMVTVLRSRNVITSYDKQIIKSQGDKKTCNAKLLEILTRKPDSAYHYFVDGLETSGQRHIAGLLLPKGWYRKMKFRRSLFGLYVSMEKLCFGFLVRNSTL